MGDSLKNIKDLENLDDSEELIKLANDLNEGRIDMDSLTEKITDKSIDELTEKEKQESTEKVNKLLVRMQKSQHKQSKSSTTGKQPMDSSFHAIRLSKATTTIQSFYRGHKARKQLKVKAEGKGNKSTVNSGKYSTQEEKVINEFYNMVSKKGISLEALFRICDKNDNKEISPEEFRESISTLKIGLTEGQIRRLLLMFDEDCNGSIRLQEYYNTLEAYNVHEEVHRDSGRTYQQECLIKLVGALHTRELDFHEVFNLCDVNKDNTINLAEMQKFIQGVLPEFSEKEIYAVLRYLDCDTSGIVDHDEFIRQSKMAEMAWKQRFTRPKAAWTGDEGIGKTNMYRTTPKFGSSRGFGDTQGSAMYEPYSQTYTSQTFKELKAIVHKMETEGIMISEFFEYITTPDAKIAIGDLTRKLEFYYPTLTKPEKFTIIKAGEIRDGLIDLLDIQIILQNHSQNPEMTVNQYFHMLGGRISSTGVSPENYLKNIGIFPHNKMTYNDMLNTLGKNMGLSPMAMSKIFESLDTDQDRIVMTNDLLEVLETYMEASAYPDHEIASPQIRDLTRTEDTITFLAKKIREVNLTPVQIYHMAEGGGSEEREGVPAEDLTKATLKLLHGPLPKEQMAAAMKSLEDSHSGCVKKQSFIDAFDAALGGASTSAISRAPKSQGVSLDKEGMYYIKKLDNILLLQNLTPTALFKRADKNKNKIITIDELKAAMKELLPEENLSMAEIMKIMRTFDVNKNGKIEQGEFIDVFLKARDSSFVVSMNSPRQPANEIYEKERQSTLPMKGTKQTITMGEGALGTTQLGSAKLPELTQIIDRIEKSQNHLKLILQKGEINKLGKFMLATLNKLLGEDIGDVCTPTQRFSILRKMDSDHDGLISPVDIMQFLQLYCSPNSSVVLEAKYMGNYIKYIERKGIRDFIEGIEGFSNGRISEWELRTHLVPIFNFTKQSMQAIINYLRGLATGSNQGAKLLSQEELIKLIQKYSLKDSTENLETSLPRGEKLLRDMVNTIRNSGKSIKGFLEEREITPEMNITYPIFKTKFVGEWTLEEQEANAIFHYIRKVRTRNDSITGKDLQVELNNALSKNISLELDAAEERAKILITKLEKEYSPMTILDVFNKAEFKGQGHLRVFDILELFKKDCAKTSRDEVKGILKVLFKHADGNFTLQELQSYLKKNTKSGKCSVLLENKLQAYMSEKVMAQPYDVYCKEKGINVAGTLSQREWKQTTQTLKIDETVGAILFNQLNVNGKLPFENYINEVYKFRSDTSGKGAKGGKTVKPDDMYEGGLVSNLQELTIMVENYEETGIPIIETLDCLLFNEDARIPVKSVQNALNSIYQNSTPKENMKFLKLLDPKPAKPGMLSLFILIELIQNCSREKYDIEATLIHLGRKFEEEIHDSTENYILSQDIQSDSSLDVAEFVSKLGSELSMRRVDMYFLFYHLKPTDSIILPISIFIEEIEKARRRVSSEDTSGIPGAGGLAPADSSLIEQKISKSEKLKNGIGKVQKYLNPLNLAKRKENTEEMYTTMDTNKDGIVSKLEFMNGMRKLDVGLTQTEIIALMDLADRNQDGKISLDEFISLLNVVKIQKSPDVMTPKPTTPDDKKKRSIPVGEMQVIEPSESETDIDNDVNKPPTTVKREDVKIGEALAKLKKFNNEHPASFENLQSRFDKPDVEAEGKLNSHKFMRVLQDLDCGLSKAEQRAITQFADKNHDGYIDYEEFSDLISSLTMQELKSQTTAQNSDDDAKPNDMNVSEEMVEGAEAAPAAPPMKKATLKVPGGQVKKKVKVAGESKEDKKKRKFRSGIHQMSAIMKYDLNPEVDYLRQGCTTILNSEQAALVKCEKLYAKLEQMEEENARFKDPDFGSKTDEEEDEMNKKSLYWDRPPPMYTQPENVIWLPPYEFLDSQPHFTEGGAGANDVKQGAIGDCWLIGALSVLATRDELLQGFAKLKIDPNADITDDVAQAMSMGVYPPMFHLYQKKGIWCFRFFKEMKWRYVIIDDRLPCNRANRLPIFGTCTNLTELWVPLIEKAYAKLHRCYESLISGFLDDALTDLTGLVSEKVKLHNNRDEFPHKSIESTDWLWGRLQTECKNKTMLGCSVQGGATEHQVMENNMPTGVLAGHAYGILDVFEIPKTGGKRPVSRLLRIRNPWGNTEWNRKWSDNSPEIDNAKIAIEAYSKGLSLDERWVPGEDDGSFLMCFKDWRNIYNNLFMCIDFPPTWGGLRAKYMWNKAAGTAQGLPNKPDAFDRFARNPQFKIQLKAPKTELFISLTQKDGRLQEGLKFPYPTVIVPACIIIMNVPNNIQKITKFEKSLVNTISVVKEHREVSARVVLKKGTYSIMPCAKGLGMEGEFDLSIYHSCPDKDMTIECLNDATVAFSPIAEEEELLIAKSGKTKLLIKERLMATLDEQEGDQGDYIQGKLDEGILTLNDVVGSIPYEVPKEEEEEVKKVAKPLKKVNLNYTLTKADYFRKGCTTILNSEIACFAKCEEIYQKLKKEGETSYYIDTEFGSQSDDPNDTLHKRSLYWTDKPANTLLYSIESIKWAHAKELSDKRVRFVEEGASSNDVKQGRLGDCWLLGALSVLATRDELISGCGMSVDPTKEISDEVAEQLSQGSHPALFHVYSKRGIWVIRIFKEFQWRYVILDDRFPVLKSNNLICFGTCRSVNEIWVPLIEKAFAKLHICYEALVEGFIDDGLSDLSGLVSEKLRLHGRNGLFPSKAVKSTDMFWARLMKERRNETMMGCSAEKKKGQEHEQFIKFKTDGTSTGLMSGHAYGILDVFEIPKKTGKMARLLRIRNPWGQTEWLGRWSDNSEQVTENKKALDKYSSKLPPEERWKIDDQDGDFLMAYSDWREIFEHLYMCVDFPNNWSGMRVFDNWNHSNSGGLPMKKDLYDDFALNPQYMMELSRPTEVFMSLGQKDGRLVPGNRFPYPEVIHPVCVLCIDAPDGQKLITFEPPKVKAQSVVKEHRELSVRATLVAGKYIIVPATKDQGMYGDFHLSIYFDCPKADINLSKIGDNRLPFDIIAEEEEGEKIDQDKKDAIQARLLEIVYELGGNEGEIKMMDLTADDISNISADQGDNGNDESDLGDVEENYEDIY